MSEIKDLHFQHTFKSGKVMRLTAYRKADTKPRVVSDKVDMLDYSELAEYMKWRDQIIAQMMNMFTPGEVFASAEHCAEIIDRRAK